MASQAAARSQFENEKRSREGAMVFPKQKIKLDVGGVSFSTTLSTLVSLPGSLLAAMFRFPDTSNCVEYVHKSKKIFLSPS